MLVRHALNSHRTHSDGRIDGKSSGSWTARLGMILARSLRRFNCEPWDGGPITAQAPGWRPSSCSADCCRTSRSSRACWPQGVAWMSLIPIATGVVHATAIVTVGAIATCASVSTIVIAAIAATVTEQGARCPAALCALYSESLVTRHSSPGSREKDVIPAKAGTRLTLPEKAMSESGSPPPRERRRVRNRWLRTPVTGDE